MRTCSAPINVEIKSGFSGWCDDDVWQLSGMLLVLWGIESLRPANHWIQVLLIKRQQIAVSPSSLQISSDVADCCSVESYQHCYTKEVWYVDSDSQVLWLTGNMRMWLLPASIYSLTIIYILYILSLVVSLETMSKYWQPFSLGKVMILK